MYVNAQVTAVIMMLEFLGTCLIAVSFMVWDGFTRFTSSAIFMLLHFIVLSYAHLKNTRNNKNRIIEYGWSNVFKNILGCSTQKVHPLISPSAEKGNDANVVSNPKAQEQEGDERNTSKVLNKQSIVPPKDIKSIIRDESKEKIDQAEICKYEFEMLKVSSNGDNIYLSRAPQGISTNISKGAERESCDKFSGEGGSCSIGYAAQESLRWSKNTSGKTERNATISSKRSKMLNDLLFNLSEETVYIKVLRHFVELERLYQNNEDLDKLTYDNMNNFIYKLPHFVGSIDRKLEMRTTILHKLQTRTSEDEAFEEYFEYFMDMEENFIENGC